MRSLPEFGLDLRNRLLASERFRRMAAAFPLTRGIARRRAAGVFDLAAGFVYSQILATCVELDAFATLAAGPLPLAELSARWSLSPDATERLVAAASALGLLQCRPGDRVGLGAAGATLVDNPGVAAMVRHHALLYRDLADPVGLLRDPAAETQLQRFWRYARAPDAARDLAEGDVAGYSALMTASQHLVAAEVLDAYPVHRHRHLLDVGGGEGAFAQAAAARAPALEVTVFDLPGVASRAAQRLATAGLGSRARAIGGDVLGERLPPGADLVSLVRVLHDHDDAAVRTILSRVREALPADGTLLVAEPMSDGDGARRAGDAYFGMYLLAMRQGRPRASGELAQFARDAGFTDVRRVQTRLPLQVSVLVARPA